MPMFRNKEWVPKSPSETDPYVSFDCIKAVRSDLEALFGDRNFPEDHVPVAGEVNASYIEVPRPLSEEEMDVLFNTATAHERPGLVVQQTESGGEGSERYYLVIIPTIPEKIEDFDTLVQLAVEHLRNLPKYSLESVTTPDDEGWVSLYLALRLPDENILGMGLKDFEPLLTELKSRPVFQSLEIQVGVNGSPVAYDDLEHIMRAQSYHLMIRKK